MRVVTVTAKAHNLRKARFDTWTRNNLKTKSMAVKLELVNKELIVTADQGLEATFFISSPVYSLPNLTDLTLDFKRKPDVNLTPIVRLTMGQGLSFELNKLKVQLTESQTASLPFNNLHWDLKGRSGGKIVMVIGGKLKINNTVTSI